MDRRAKLQSLTRPTTTAALQNATTLAKRGDRDAQLELAAALAWVAYACPDASPTVWDAVSACWLGRGEAPQIMTELPQVPLPDSFWDAFWELTSSRNIGMTIGGIPYSEVVLWLNEHKISGTDNRLEYHQWIRFLDGKYIASTNEKKDKK